MIVSKDFCVASLTGVAPLVANTVYTQAQQVAQILEGAPKNSPPSPGASMANGSLPVDNRVSGWCGSRVFVARGLDDCGVGLKLYGFKRSLARIAITPFRQSGQTRR
jgi:hypothetical protein